MNPILQMLNNGNQISTKLSQAQRMIQMVKSANNPQAMINQMLSNNPQVKQIVDQYGGDPQTAFYKYAEANGVDPNQILNMLR